MHLGEFENDSNGSGNLKKWENKKTAADLALP